MTRLTPVDPAAATGKAKELLDAVQAKMGMRPNLMRTMAASPAVLDAYLAFSGALSGGLLDAQLREQIAIAIANDNGCDYCLSAHTMLGKMAGLGPDALADAQRYAASQARVDAALKFTRQVVKTRGEVADEDIERVRSAGFSDGEIAEIIANVAINVFTNYLNNVAHTEVDFPKVALTRTTT
jgi:uncharacterized peroxidase-related enzyme